MGRRLIGCRPYADEGSGAIGDQFGPDSMRMRVEFPVAERGSLARIPTRFIMLTAIFFLAAGLVRARPVRATFALTPRVKKFSRHTAIRRVDRRLTSKVKRFGVRSKSFGQAFRLEVRSRSGRIRSREARSNFTLSITQNMFRVKGLHPVVLFSRVLHSKRERQLKLR
jgi:hypothetical protein